MTNADFYYQIGAGHIFCQDYANAGKIQIGERNYSYVAISDGCSGAKDSDLSARAMVQSVSSIIYRGLDERGSITEQIYRKMFVSRIWYYKSFLNCGLEATLFLLLHDETDDALYIFGWGDGSILLKYKDRDYANFINLSYKSGAPYYLAYRESEQLSAQYEKEFGTDYAELKEATVYPNLYTEIYSETKLKSFFKKIDKVSQSGLLFASVMSDGIHTFHKVGEPNVIMAPHVVLAEIAGYKNFHGQFVQRRMLAFKKQCMRDGYQAFDDVSVGTMAFI